VVGKSDEVEAVSAVVGDLDEYAVVVDFDGGADGAGRPASGVGEELDDVEEFVVWLAHLGLIVPAC
jgi:hypothetical protein